MTWAWDSSPDDGRQIIANYDDLDSSIPRFRLIGPGKLSSNDGTVVFNAKKHRISKIEVFGCLNCRCSVRLINRRLSDFISERIPANEFQLFPVSVVCSDGISDFFSALIPLNERKCTNIEMSSITHWLNENELALEYKFLTFNSDCLGSLALARDTVSDIFVLADQVGDAIEELQMPGVNLVRDKDLSTWPYRK